MRYASYINSNGTADNDLREFFPLGFYPANCCPCPEHRRRVADSATLMSSSSGLALWSDACKSNAFTGTISAGEAIYVEGISIAVDSGQWAVFSFDNYDREYLQRV
jgi:hypothetical protein